MNDALHVDLAPQVDSDFRELLAERGFSSINEFILDVLTQDRAEKRRAKLQDISTRMFPGSSSDRAPGA